MGTAKKKATSTKKPGARIRDLKARPIGPKDAKKVVGGTIALPMESINQIFQATKKSIETMSKSVTPEQTAAIVKGLSST